VSMAEHQLQEQQSSDRKLCLCMVFAGAAVIVASLLLSRFDKVILEYFERLGAPSIDLLMKLVRHAGSGIVLGAVVLIAFATMRDRKTATRAALSLLIAAIVVSILKYLISRQRPTGENLDSFPSGHTTAAFAVAGALFLRFRWWGALFFIIAAAVGLSRVFRGDHYMNDAIAGMGLGFVFAGFAGLVVSKAPRFASNRGLRIAAVFLTFGFAAAPFLAGRNTLSLFILVVVAPIGFFAFWPYFRTAIVWVRKSVIMALSPGAGMGFRAGREGIENRHWWFIGRRSVLGALTAKLPPGPRLEVGCGYRGGLTLDCEPVMKVGLDIEYSKLDSLRDKFGVLGVQGDAERLPLADETFSVVFLLDVLEHVRNDHFALSEVLRVLRPGGRAIVCVPAFPSLRSPHDAAEMHFRRYRRSGFLRLCRDAGFRVNRSGYLNTLLFPVALVWRVVSGWLFCSRTPRDDFWIPPRPVNGLLALLFSAERLIVPRVSLPFGLSIFAILRKPGEPDRKSTEIETMARQTAI